MDQAIKDAQAVGRAQSAAKLAPQPAPDAEGKWDGRETGLIVSTSGNVRFIARIEPHGPNGELDESDRAVMASIIRDHSAVAKLVEALSRRVSPTKCYCDVMIGAKCGECSDRELLTSLGATLVDAALVNADIDNEDRNLAAYTPSDGNFPPYVSINYINTMVEITVRSEGTEQQPGPTATIRINRWNLGKLIDDAKINLH